MTPLRPFAGTKSIGASTGMPKMGLAFSGWLSKITLAKIVQSVTAGLVSETQTDIVFDGVVQPLNAKQIALKPEGQRAWQWYMIHCFSGPLDLNNNDLIYYDGQRWKVMGKWDYKLDNYIQYDIVKDFGNE